MEKNYRQNPPALYQQTAQTAQGAFKNLKRPPLDPKQRVGNFFPQAAKLFEGLTNS